MNQSKTEFYASLPKKRMGSGVLFFNGSGEILIVQPTYKELWEIPGGIVEADESPLTTAQREIHEELGLNIDPSSLNLKGLEYMSAGDGKPEALFFLFAGGELSMDQQSQIRIDQKELKSFKFINIELVEDFLGSILGPRVKRCLVQESFIYMEGAY